MTLDYVLAHPRQRFLATESARVEYFTQCGIERMRLPQLVYRARRRGPSTARYFVEKFPLAVHTDGSIGLSYIDPGEYAVDGFETFLERYTPLIVSLPCVRITYVADLTRNFSAAATCFKSWTNTACDTHGVPRDEATIKQMLHYFADLFLVETHQAATIRIARLDEMREERKRFGARDCQDLYQLWQDVGETAVRDRIAQTMNAGADRCVDFATYQLPHDYRLLGAPTYVH
jgi:hypothetical protein